MKHRFVQPYYDAKGNIDKVGVNCPGCETEHLIPVAPAGSVQAWSFDGDYERPTFELNMRWGKGKEPRCRAGIRFGTWIFHTDCEHELAGEAVPMIPLEGADEARKPLVMESRIRDMRREFQRIEERLKDILNG